MSHLRQIRCNPNEATFWFSYCPPKIFVLEDLRKRIRDEIPIVINADKGRRVAHQAS